MPVVAVAGAIYAGSTIATVGLAAMSAFEIVSAVGAIASGIGAVTGNEDLMKIGGIASLAGGIGAFVSGSASAASGAGMTSAEQASNTTAMMNTQAPGVVDPTVAVQPVADAAQATADAATGAAQTTGLAGADSSITQGITGQNGLIDAASMADEAVASGGMASVPQGGQGYSAFGGNPDFNAKDVLMMNKAGTTAQSASKNVFGSIGDFLKNNFLDKDGRLDKNLMSFGMNFLGGMFDEAKEAQTDYLKSRNQELQNQMRNANAIPDMSGFKIKPKNIMPKTPMRVGLISA